jgi:AcrR family transcriptional regulator
MRGVEVGEENSADSDESARPGRQERKERSRRRILEAAREVFVRDGFMDANLDEVAERAGVAKGTLYRYFENKAELYVGVLADNARVFEEKMRGAATGAALPPPEQVRQIARFYLEHWTSHPEYFRIFWAIENQSVIGELPPQVVDQVKRVWEQNLRILNSVLERGVREGCFRECETWEVANILWTLANGLIQADQVSPRRELRRLPLERVFGDAVEIVLRGLELRRGTPA